MTADQFRRIALSLPEAVESTHMRHPVFRLGGKIFAMLGYPREGFGMVWLSPDEQHRAVLAAPAVFAACSRPRDSKDPTSVHLPSAASVLVRPALKAARQLLDTPPPKRKRT